VTHELSHYKSTESTVRGWFVETKWDTEFQRRFRTIENVGTCFVPEKFFTGEAPVVYYVSDENVERVQDVFVRSPQVDASCQVCIRFHFDRLRRQRIHGG
jgi:hypothetical protein